MKSLPIPREIATPNGGRMMLQIITSKLMMFFDLNQKYRDLIISLLNTI
jgi:hypothetical protein